MNFSRSIETSIMFQSFFKKGYSSSLTLLRLLNNQYSDIICPKCVRKKKKPLIISGFCRGGRIRTYDLHIPNVARYRATLHPEKVSPLLIVMQIYSDFFTCQEFFFISIITT